MAFKLTPPSISQSLNLPISQSPNLPVSISQSLNLSINQSTHPSIQSCIHPSACLPLPLCRRNRAFGCRCFPSSGLPPLFRLDRSRHRSLRAASRYEQIAQPASNSLPLRRSLSLSHPTTHHPPPTTPPSCQPAPPSHDPRAPPAIATPTLRRSIT